MAKASISEQNSLLRTPLYDLSVALKGKMTAFAGWEMAVVYQGLKQEHLAVRSAVGMFDISHMGKFQLQGPGLLDQLQRLVPSDLSRLQPGKAQYTVLLNEQGGIIDDVIFYLQEPHSTGASQGMLIVNAATSDKDKAWLLAHLDTQTIAFDDLSRDRALIALQGPQAWEKLQPFVSEDLSVLKAFGHLTGTIFNTAAFIARTGYTGEDGFEIMVSPTAGQALWRSLLGAGVEPCGLGARDTLRLEAAMGLYGQDMDETTTPWEAGLGWLVHLDKTTDFMGRSSLEQQKVQGLPRRLVGLQMAGRHIARQGYPVLFEGQSVGTVTSGTLGPTVNQAIALAYVPSHLGKVGQALTVEIRGKQYPATVIKKPFYRSTTRLSAS